ncbi:GH39 family glycosyl hydrolase [Flavisolibacter nicotianae]|uniref:GH39 family glycosyl hydrolase n=1 Tax=Flavisolibacter nicotianae TaxID=2364882 RepID=UPI000EB446AA|nr:beta-xylosidase [Flavisolibacter nicotianae]
MNKRFLCSAVFCVAIFFHQAVIAQSTARNITVDLAKSKGPLKPIWAFFGYDEPNYTYMKDGRKLLTELSALSPVPVYVRTHNLLTTGDGTPSLKWGSTNAYTEDAAGNPVYNWRIVDSIFDTYVQRGMKPIAEIGFVPKALSAKPEPYQHRWSPADKYSQIFTGWAYPPIDYRKWGELVYQWVKHCVVRYGAKEVQSWWWEVWNEPDIPYWQGTQEEYFKLYDFAADGLKRALPKARIGGPTTTSPRSAKANDYLKNFLQHCAEGTNYASGKKGAPLDYISFHAKGSPKFMNGFVRMDMSVQLMDVYKGFETVAKSPFKNLPIIIGECDPEGCAACSVQYNPQNAYRNGTMYSSYTAASYARLYDLAEQAGVNLEGAVSWSFEFEAQPWFAGFRDLATNGVDKPVLNVFRLFGKMKGERLAVENDYAFSPGQLIAKGVHDSLADINAIASADKKAAYVMVWNYYDDDLPAAPALVSIAVKNIPAKNIRVKEYRIDQTHSNSYTVWKEMGSPQQVTSEQYAALEKAGQLQQIAEGQKVIQNGVYSGTISLPRQAVSLLELQW